VWGSGSSAAADGTKYELAENSLLAEYSIRYGGYGGTAYHPICRRSGTELEVRCCHVHNGRI
jgi:TnpA family transposase